MANALLRQAREVASNCVLLAVLDARRAAIRFTWLVCMSLMAAVLAVTAWISLVVVGTVGVLGSGTSWITALGVVAAVNLVAAGVLVGRIHRLIAEMPFAATLRQLSGEAPRADSGKRDP